MAAFRWRSSSSSAVSVARASSRCEQRPRATAGSTKIEQRARDPLLDDLGALDVDLEDDVVAGRERLADLAARRAVPVAVDLVRLEQPAGVAQGAGTSLAIEEVVVDAVDLAGPRRARRAGHDVVVVGVVRPRAAARR